ncbi:ABC transporter permease [Lactobacillus sp. CC-MHH1034]|uniref:ABC transporter permease n=1 Tax=Agrilactobacillus fermenti TaxID=2586909 RepID=UPI001E2FE640|nr:ABC transporter permease [Agrilactobacillus fermenti]MCD2255633.1 ABC transporter permease [Agrilactobacillus fermenti]
MNKLWVIIKQVYLKNIKSGSFIFLVLSPIIFGLVGLGIGYLVMHSQTTPNIAVITDTPAAQQILAKNKSDFKVTQNITTAAAAEKALRSKKIDGYLTLNLQQATPQASLIQRQGGNTVSSTTLKTQLTALKTNVMAAKLKLTPQQTRALMQPINLKQKTLVFKDGHQASNRNDRQQAIIIAINVITIAIFIFLAYYSQIIAQEIASEKGSRIMEIILSSISATTHFLGKIIAMLMLMFTQVLFYLIIGGIAYQVFKDNQTVTSIMKSVDLSILTAPEIIYAFVFGFIAILLYVIAAAMLASVVSRQEQTSQAVTPIMMLGLLGYYGGILVMGGTKSSVINIGSYIPFIGQSIMPIRLAAGDATTLNAWLSLGITVIFLILLTAVAVTFYRSNVLVYSDSGFFKSFKTSWSIMRSERKQKRA